jgi:GNAT superfamily N-acetyltransferase
MQGEVKIIRIQQPEYMQVLALRQEVLRKPLGLNLYEEDLTGELDAHIFIYEAASKVVGCVLAFPVDHDTIRLKQMAVDPAIQKSGIGSKLMLAAEEFARSKGFCKIYFHARAAAIPFYEKLGYEIWSDTFDEVGIPHKKMGKML